MRYDELSRHAHSLSTSFPVFYLGVPRSLPPPTGHFALKFGLWSLWRFRQEWFFGSTSHIPKFCVARKVVPTSPVVLDPFVCFFLSCFGFFFCVCLRLHVCLRICLRMCLRVLSPFPLSHPSVRSLSLSATLGTCAWMLRNLLFLLLLLLLLRH